MQNTPAAALGTHCVTPSMLFQSSLRNS